MDQKPVKRNIVVIGAPSCTIALRTLMRESDHAIVSINDIALSTDKPWNSCFLNETERLIGTQILADTKKNSSKKRKKRRWESERMFW